MNRRRFLTTSLSAAGAGALAAGANAQTPAAAPEYYELRQYHLRVTMRQRFSDHFRDEAAAGVHPRRRRAHRRVHGGVRSR